MHTTKLGEDLQIIRTGNLQERKDVSIRIQAFMNYLATELSNEKRKSAQLQKIISKGKR